jgi:hypothetical protein
MYENNHQIIMKAIFVRRNASKQSHVAGHFGFSVY